MLRFSFQQINEELDIEYFLQWESIVYCEICGVFGIQFNIKICLNFVCCDVWWCIYFGVEIGKGNCFVCSKSFFVVSFIYDYYDYGEWGLIFKECEEVMCEQGWWLK